MAATNDFTISPFVMGIRLDRMLTHIENGRTDKAIKLCNKYISAFETTPITSPVDSTEVVKELEFCCLLLLCGATSSAHDICKHYRDIFEAQVNNFYEVNGLVMNPEANTKDIGTLEKLPMLARDAIMSLVRKDYW